jgi:hypothetical protein
MTEEETVDLSAEGQKQSKQNRWRGAISRTKSKFKSKDDKTLDDKSSDGEATLPDDVNKFLQAGRPSTLDFQNPDSLPKHPAPRRVQVPRIDVSTSQRWPNQQTLKLEESSALLHPEYQIRSQSQGSLHRRQNRPRNLSVSFDDAPPVVIGIGGDEAETPPIEISRPRARSASPLSQSRMRAGVVEEPSPTRRDSEGEVTESTHESSKKLLPGYQLEMVDTGMAHLMDPKSNSDFNREFDMTRRRESGPASPDSTALVVSNTKQPEYQPATRDAAPTALAPTLRSALTSHDAHGQFEGQALREGHNGEFSNSRPDSGKEE